MTESPFGRPRLLIQFVTRAKVMIQSGNILIKVEKKNIQISLIALCMKLEDPIMHPLCMQVGDPGQELKGLGA